MNRIRAVVTLAIAALLTPGLGGAQTVRMQRALGGSAADQFYSAIELPGQTALLVGSTRSNDDELASRQSLDFDGWLVRINLQGDVLWSQPYGGSYNDELRSAVALPDGGFVAVGHTESPPLTHGGRDAWVICIDGLGRLRWQRAYGGSGNDAARAVVALPDGGFIVVGETGSADGDASGGAVGHHGGADAWLLRLDARGAIVWQRPFGGSGNETLWAVVATSEGTFVAAGGTDSGDGELPPNRGKTDALLIHFSLDGQVRWRHTFGGSSFDEFYSLALHRGQIVAAGTTQSRDGTVRDHRGNGDVWVVATDATGYPRYSASYGGTGDEGANHIAPTRDGGLLIAATARSRDGQRTVFRGVFDGWLLKLDPAGKLVWQKSVGGFQNDAFHFALETAQGPSLVVGATSSNDYDLSSVLTHGSVDAWALVIADPQAPPPKDEALPTFLTGYVSDKATGRRLAAEVTLVDYTTLKPIRAVRTDTASALYQLVLTRGTDLGLNVIAPGYLLENFPLRLVPAQLGTQVRLDVALTPLRPDTSINLYHIYFLTGSPKLRSESTLELQNLLEFLRENPSVSVRIIGHTDATATDRAGQQQLSTYRALEVKSWLQERGIAGPRMEAIGVGSSRPIADEATEQGRARNRRVEIVITNH